MGTVITSLLCGLALAMNIAWHRYIVYINDNDEVGSSFIKKKISKKKINRKIIKLFDKV